MTTDHGIGHGAAAPAPGRRSASAAASVRMHIPRLTLHGIALDPRHERTVRSAVEAELASLLAGAPLPTRLQAGGMARRLPEAEPEIGSWTDPGDLGRQVARAVYEGLGR